jgi:hypothetical protein
VAAIAALHLGLSVALETVLPQLRDPDYGYRLVRARAAQRQYPDRPLIAVFGTSRTQNAIDPSAMAFPPAPGVPLVFNFGQAGAHPVHIPLALQRLRDDGLTPAAVLVELFPATLASPVPCDGLFFDSAARLTAADVHALVPYLSHPETIRRRWVESRANSWYTYRSVVIDHLDPEWHPWDRRSSPQWLEMDRLGFRPYRMRAGADDCRLEKLARSRAAHESNLHAASVSPAADRAIRALIADCRDTETPLAFFFAPESPEFRSWYSPEWRSAVAAYARTLREEFGCPVFDAPEFFTESDFADGHHMLPRAAAAYSSWLAERHLRPWLTATLGEGRGFSSNR